MKQVLLINQGNGHNLGDTAIHSCLVHLFKELGYNPRHAGFASEMPGFSPCTRSSIYREPNEFSLLTRIRRCVIPYRLLWTARNLTRLFQTLHATHDDLVVFGGGEMLQPNYVFPWALLCWVFITTSIYKRKCFIIAVGVSSGYRVLDRFYIRLTAKLCPAIAVRDSESKARLDALLKRESCIVMPDVAFLTSELIEPMLAKSNQTVLCPTSYDFYVRKQKQHPMSHTDYTNWWVQQAITEARRGKVVSLVCTGPHPDAEYHRFLAEQIRENHGYAVETKQPQTVEELAQCLAVETVISGRLHALIIGFSMGATPVPFLTSEKLAAYSATYLKGTLGTKELKGVICNATRKLLANIDL